MLNEDDLIDFKNIVSPNIHFFKITPPTFILPYKGPSLKYIPIGKSLI